MQWISVQERMPEAQTLVIVTDGQGVDVGGHFRGKWTSPGVVDDVIVTHWMPLPEPPKE